MTPTSHPKTNSWNPPKKKVPGMFVGVSSWKQLGILSDSMLVFGVYTFKWKYDKNKLKKYYISRLLLLPVERRLFVLKKVLLYHWSRPPSQTCFTQIFGALSRDVLLSLEICGTRMEHQLQPVCSSHLVGLCLPPLCAESARHGFLNWNVESTL